MRRGIGVAWVTGGFTRVLWGRTLSSETKGCHKLAQDLNVGSRKRGEAADEKLHMAHQSGEADLRRVVWLIGLGFGVILG